MSAERTSDVRRSRAARIAGLYVVTPDVDATGVLVAKVVAALEGGASVVQYRNKTAAEAARRVQAQALASVHARRGGLFIVNDDPDLAADVDADGVHVGEDDCAVAAARARIGPDRLIGVSCYGDLDRARAAVDAGADYVAFGSFFASATKPHARRAGIDVLARARALGVPIVAIGGITASNARELIDAGAHAVAVVGDVFAPDDAVDVARAAAAIAALFGGAQGRAQDGRGARVNGVERERR
jgi:thiamine-phosphate pyrophosphorylase